MGNRCQAKKTGASRRFMVRAGISPFSAFPRCDVCNLLRGRLRQVGRWMIHPACYDEELVTLRLPRLQYPRPRRFTTGRFQQAVVMLYAMAAKLEGQARRRLRLLSAEDLLDVFRASQLTDYAPADLSQFGPSGRSFDGTRSEQIRRQGQELIHGQYST